MIKLIASDMDGTLLNDEKKISPQFWDLFKEFRARDIRFAVASGRQYYSLENLFQQVRDDMIFIADNGTIVFYKGEIIHLDTIPGETVRKIIRYVRENCGAVPMISGVNSAYVEPCDGRVMEMAKHYHARLQIVDDLCEVDDQFLKIALCDLDGAEMNSYPRMQSFQSEVQVVLSGDIWVDMISSTANKGSAITEVFNKFAITPEETMAFGDYLNDLELLKTVHHSYAMANSHPQVKDAARFQTLSNNENGVVYAIRNMLDASSGS